jgi:diguanylate cyclase (GGDEF)-like protein
VAFFLAVRVVALDGRVHARGRSWVLLVLAMALLAVLFAISLFVDHGATSSALLWTQTLVGSALVVALVIGCYFLYGRELHVIGDLRRAADTHSRRSRRLEAVVGLGADLRSVHGVDEVALAAASAVERTLAFKETALYIYDPAEDVFRTAVALGSHPDYDAVVRDRRIPPAVVRGVLREDSHHGNVYFIDHTRYEWTDEELFYFPPGPIPDGGPGAFHADDALFAPLYDHEGALIGLFDLYEPADGRIPGEETLQMLEVFANVTASALENAAYAAELEQLAVTDGLTALYNHRHFHVLLAAEVERAQRYDLTFSLLMMDLDLFKNVNDRLGHPRGDDALRAVADVMRASARSTDVAARYGGEEFVMILPGTSMKQAVAVAERVARGVREIDLEVPDPPRLSISIGIAEFPACGRDRESLIAAADAALLFAKRSGRDMIADFSQISLVELDHAALEGLAFRLEKADIETLETLAAAIDRRDVFAHEHAHDVAVAAERLAVTLGLDDQQRDVLRMAALVYDIGKVGIPVEVLNRRGSLTPEELEAVRRHPEIGKRLLESTMRLNALLPVVLHHHERWDGTGYPSGLSGEEIPFAARVLAICDAWQAMTTDRPYRPAFARERALGELRAGAGTQFDPELVDAFIASLDSPAGSPG